MGTEQDKLIEQTETTTCSMVLRTKDGKQIGNAYCYAFKEINDVVVHLIETDYGNKLELLGKDLYTLFWVKVEPNMTYESWSKGKKVLSSSGRQAIISLDDLTVNQCALIASYVEKASNYELNPRCDSVQKSDFDGWSGDEKTSLCQMLDKWNGSEASGTFTDVMEVPSWMLVSFGAWLIAPDPINEDNRL